MNQLISELLNLARLESGQLSIAYETVLLAPFMENIKEKYRSLLAEKNQQLHISLPENCPSIETDPTRLHQILSNLLSNAVRHAYEASSIFIKIAKENNTMIFSVINTGEGIAEKDLPYLWERFYRTDKSRSRNHGGTGLGLAITKKVVESMGGEITAASILNQETTFTVKLPLKKFSVK